MMEQEQTDPALLEVARKLRESKPGTLVAVPQAAIAAADAPLAQAISRELKALRAVERCRCGYPMPCTLSVPIGFCKA